MSRRDDQRLTRQPNRDAPVSRRTTASRGVAPEKDLRPEDEPGLGELVPYAFDLPVIIAAPPTGSTTTLIGVGGTLQLPRIPPRCRAYLDGISPYLEDAIGPIVTPFIPGAGVTITWQIFLDGKAAGYYGQITTLLDAWGYVSPRPLLEVPEQALLSVTVNNVDPGGIYKRLGVRIRGRWVPVKRDRGERARGQRS